MFKLAADLFTVQTTKRTTPPDPLAPPPDPNDAALIHHGSSTSDQNICAVLHLNAESPRPSPSRSRNVRTRQSSGCACGAAAVDNAPPRHESFASPPSVCVVSRSTATTNELKHLLFEMEQHAAMPREFGCWGVFTRIISGIF